MSAEELKPEDVQDWINLIKIASDPTSPFKGMVDLNGIFSLPLAMQHEIYNGLSDSEKVDLTIAYGKRPKVKPTFTGLSR